jgi:hypothetical protein
VSIHVRETGKGRRYDVKLRDRVGVMHTIASFAFASASSSAAAGCNPSPKTIQDGSTTGPTDRAAAGLCRSEPRLVSEAGAS